jgi:dTDP-4-amino-4,6-dideoxygalactose transaminase
VASGTDALILALRAQAMQRKSKGYFNKSCEVITTPFTFVATAEAIVRAGATPVFVDIDPDTFNISPKAVKAAITKNTAGIVPVHLFGQPAGLSQIMKIAYEYKLFVVEDTAQAFGAVYKGKRAGTFGSCGCYSFFPSKNLGSFGDAGLVSTDDSRIFDLLGALRNHGQKSKYNAEHIGYNSRLDSIQAAILLAKLKHIDKFNQMRIKAAQKYNRYLKGIKQIQVPQTRYEIRDTRYKSSHVYHLYTIKVSEKRDALLKHLNTKGIMARVYYPVALYEMKAFKAAKIRGSCKATKEALEKVISLPLHPFLKDEQIKYVCKAIVDFYN